jgi:hypothetical protein
VLTATVASKSVEVTVEIASKERYEALLRSGAFNASGESEEAAVAAVARGSIGAATTLIEPERPDQRLYWIALGGGTALVLGVVGFWVMRRKRRGAGGPPSASVQAAAPEAQARKPSGKLCPLCGTQYPPDSQFCGQDGAQLVPMN